MDNLADALILGYSECSRLGVYTEPKDETGRQWIQFHACGLRLPILKTQGGSRGFASEGGGASGSSVAANMSIDSVARSVGVYPSYSVEVSGPDLRAVEVELDDRGYEVARE